MHDIVIGWFMNRYFTFDVGCVRVAPVGATTGLTDAPASRFEKCRESRRQGR
jgi:hypothetical protein